MTSRYAWSICLHDPRAAQAFVQNWRRGSEAVQNHPGAGGATLHTVNGDLGVYMAITEWETRDARAEAIQAATADPDRDWSVPESLGKLVEHGWLDEIARVTK